MLIWSQRTLRPNLLFHLLHQPHPSRGYYQHDFELAKLDDVYPEDFEKSLVLQTAASSDNLRTIQDLLLSKRFNAVHISEPESSGCSLPLRPYFL